MIYLVRSVNKVKMTALTLVSVGRRAAASRAGSWRWQLTLDSVLCLSVKSIRCRQAGNSVALEKDAVEALLCVAMSPVKENSGMQIASVTSYICVNSILTFNGDSSHVNLSFDRSRYQLLAVSGKILECNSAVSSFGFRCSPAARSF